MIRTFRIALLALLLSWLNPLQLPIMGQVAKGATTANPLLKLKGLVTLCGRKDAASMAACGSYITGFVAGSQATQRAASMTVVANGIINGTVAPTDQAMEAAGAKFQRQLNLFCIHSVWTAGYIQAVVVQYGREHPDQLNEDTADHMLNILAKAFPCDEQPKQSN